MTMITLSDTTSHGQSWQWHLRHAIKGIPELASYVGIQLNEINQDFPLLAPRPYLDRIEKNKISDPLLLQILPRSLEERSGSQYFKDPLQEGSFKTNARGLIQKYNNRALVIATGTCAINCRYCFRRHFPYEENSPSRADWAQIYSYLAKNSNISEVILSGGDPLILNDNRLKQIITEINSIRTVDTIRVHTRLPVVIPQRICEKLLKWVNTCRKKLVFVLHINHPNELDNQVVDAVAKLRSAGAILLNQSVLLRDINNSPEVLEALSKKLFSAGILPYYLHLLDPVKGAQHFDVPQQEGVNLIGKISKQLPGYLVPKLSKEVPGADSKIVIAAP